MNTSTVISAFSSVSGNLTIFLAICLLCAGGLVWYALHEKGDVRAELSHGRTVFKLEAKEKIQRNHRQ